MKVAVVAALAVAALGVAALAVTVARRGGISPGAVSDGRALISDDHRFVNGPTAASTFASISERLMADGNACTGRWGHSDPRCTARLSAAAYASVVAAMLVNCTQPGVYEARRSLDEELREIALFRGGPPPTVPPLPSC